MKVNKFFLYLLFCFLPFKLYAQYDSKYLEAAEKAANWITSLKKESGSEGIYWPAYAGNSYSTLGKDIGASGIGLFFLKLYETTNNPDYLTKAEKAASYIYSQKSSWYYVDWLNGTAGLGLYFIDLYNVTSKEIYISYAVEAADWLKRKVIEDSDGCYHWSNPINPGKLYTGLAHGTAGIGAFFLKLFEVTGEINYLEFAEKSMKWVEKHYLELGSESIAWKRLTDDSDAYFLWCGGSVGIMFFLEDLFLVTHNDHYKQLLQQSTNALVEYADNMGEGRYAWNYSPQGGNHPLVYCHGASSVSHILFRMYELFNDQNIVKLAEGGMKWLEDQKVLFNDEQYYWPHIDTYNRYDTGLLNGTAGIGHAFIEANKLHENENYITHAIGAADYLISIAEQPAENQLKWINYTNAYSQGYGDKEYETGWYSGAAGIGIFFLELHETLNSTVGINENTQNLSRKFELKQNYPNPFNPSTIIQYYLAEPGQVKITIHNLLGQEIKILVEEFQLSGKHQVSWNAEGLAGGIYFCRLQSGNSAKTRKLVLVK